MESKKVHFQGIDEKDIHLTRQKKREEMVRSRKTQKTQKLITK